MKSFFTLLIFLGSFCFSAIGQDGQTVLDKVSIKVQSAKGINISFVLTQKDRNSKTIGLSKGVLKMKGNKYYLKQNDIEIFCNGLQVWNYDGNSEVTVTKAENVQDDLSPQQILTGFSKKDFSIKLLSSAGSNYQVQLLPVDKRKNFKQVILFVNKSSNLITKAVITDKTNSVTEISFSNISLNSSIPDTQFVFDPSKHPGVEVINQ